jgi:Phosphotransferase enzyme family
MERIMEDPAPTTLEEVLAPSWLTRALAPRYPGVRVTASTVTWRQDNVATKVRFRIDVEPMTSPPPSFWCVKGYWGRPDRYAAGDREAEFYRTLATTLPIRVPACDYVGSDPTTGHSIVLMHDLTAEGSNFLTALSPYSVELAAATLDQLALLHASRGSDETVRGARWLDSRMATMASYIPPDVLQSLLDGRRGTPLPTAIKDAARLGAGMRKLGESADNGPLCLVHGDAHAGNVFLTGDGSVGIIDWQVVHRGSWACDVAYHIAAVLSVETREKAETELLAHYLERLRAHGGEAPAWDEAWASYRRFLVYGYFLWAMTRFVDEEITVEFVKRLGTAVAQHESFEAIGV